MEIVSVAKIQAIAGSSLGGECISVVETPVVGKQKTNRITTTSKSADDGQTSSVLVEEFQDGKLSSRHFEQFRPFKSSTRENFDKDGILISSETERKDELGQLTKIVIKGAGKSSTTRVMCGENEARATERSVLVETPRASYCYQPFDGKWSSYYKEIGLKLELKSSYLKSPDSTLEGPDGIKLIFRGGKLVDMILTALSVPTNSLVHPLTSSLIAE